MSWEDQGRQEHMWFGHGTAPAKAKPVSGDGVPSRIDAVAHSALANMPRVNRGRATAWFDRGRLQQLRTAMTAWIGARSLGDAAFADRFMGPAAGSVATGRLRAAAEGVRTAQTHRDLAATSGDLAAAMLDIGLDKWPGFLRDAAERADASATAAGRVVLAQAATPNRATDASMGETAPLASAFGRYVTDDPNHWNGQSSVGDGECVALVRKATGAPQAKTWSSGVPVKGNTAIQPGTAIATFDAGGHYIGHAAIYLGQDMNSIRVIDQWNNRESGRVISQHSPSVRSLPFNSSKSTYVNKGESYRVVQ